LIQIASVVGLFYVFALPFQLSRLPNRPKDYSAPLLTGRLAMTRAELLRHALSQALLATFMLGLRRNGAS